MKRIVFLILLLVLAIFAISFTLLNSQKVHLSYYFASIDTDLMYVIFVSICIGVLMGVIATLSLALRLKYTLNRNKRKIELMEKEVANLRSLPLKDKH